MRALCVAVSFVFVLVPRVAAAQTSTAGAGRLSLQVAAGSTAKSGGYVLSAGAAFSPLSRLELIVNAEQIYLRTRTEHFGGDSVGVTRGGRMTFVSGEVRVSLLPPERVSPFVLAGTGAGISRPNVNDRFPNPVRNDFQIVFAGGGIRAPLSNGLSMFADVRLALGMEGDEGLIGVWPIRAGVIWRF